MPNGGHNRGRGHCQLPDTLVGIGGAGKAVVDRFLSQEWILEAGVTPNEEGHIPAGFQAYVIDTATDERAVDEPQITEHNDRITRIAEESGRSASTVRTKVQYLNPVEQVPDPLLRPEEPPGDEISEEIVEVTDANTWWLRDDEVSTDRGYEFGTTRRRADGKALLQASQQAGVEMANLPERLAEGSTTIVAGLGGGTGSGMAIELAKRIESEGSWDVTLVGILPAVDEPNTQLVNAYAALSELEYLAVTDRNPFRNIILLSYDPASDLDYEDSFLNSVIETIIARENLAKAGHIFDESNGFHIPKRFAPFTLATPQTLRYNTGAIKRVIRALNEYRDEKREALDTELDLYRTLDEFFRQEWDGNVSEALEAARNGRAVDDDRFALRDHDADALRTRLDHLQSWLSDDGEFGKAQTVVISEWRECLAGWTAPEHQREATLGEFLASLSDRVDALQPVEEAYPSEPDDQLLAGVIRDELRAIGRRADLLRARNLLESEEPEASEALTAAMGPGDGVAAAIQQLDAVIGESKHRLDSHEEDRETLDAVESALIKQRDELIDTWYGAVVDDVEALVTLDANADAIESRLDAVETEVERRLQQIERVTEVDDLPRDRLSVDSPGLNDRLQAVGVEPVDTDAIERSVEHAAAAFEAWDEYNRDSILDVLPIRDRKAEAEEEYWALVRDIDDRFVRLHPAEGEDLEAEFQCRSSLTGQFDAVRTEIREKQAHHRERVASELEQLLSEWDSSTVIDPYRDRWDNDDFDVELPVAPDNVSDRIEEELAGGFEVDAADEALDDLLAAESDSEIGGVARVIVDEALLEPIHRRRERLETHASDAEERLERYDRLREIVTGLGIEFDSTGPARPEVSDPSPIDLGAEDPYVTKVESDDQFGLMQYEDIGESGVVHSNEIERRRIESYFEQQFAKTVVQNNDLGCLKERRIEVATDADGKYADVRNPTYDGHHVANVFLSRAFTDDTNPDGPIVDGVRDVFEDSNLYFRGAANGYSHQSVGFGAPWDLSLVTLVGGVFLDNIRGIERYKQAYDEERAELGDAIRIRHAHGLDGRDSRLGGGNERGYVYRDSLLDLHDPDDRYALLDSTEDEMVDRLLDEYIGQETISDSGTSE